MSKVAVVFWSGTGNTEAMANAVAEGLRETCPECELKAVSEVTPEELKDLAGFALGCPAMGDEVLEETVFQPMWDDVKGTLSGKNIALFGSYGWGDGEWMRNWEDEARDAGANLVVDCVTANNEPDDDAIEACKALGAALA